MKTDRNITILFATRIIRLFCYGFLSVILALYLAQVGLPEPQIGLLFTLTLAGDAGISLWLTTSADRFGRKRTLIVGALLMLGAGVVFIVTRNVVVLMAAAIIGVISPSGNEIGPFLSVEQAALSHLLPDEKRTQVFAWYNLVGSFATATGALSGGWLAQVLQSDGMPAWEAYRVVLMGYSIGGFVIGILFLLLSRDVEVDPTAHFESSPRILGLHKSRHVVIRLSALFSIDAFAGALIVQSMIAYWFFIKFGVNPGIIGSIFFGANVLAGISALLAVRLANRIGLINTMVFTHIPSNIFLILVPLMPTLALAIAFLLLRFSISQMDVPTRQSYTMAVVAPDERSAASGVTTIARSVGAAISPSLTGIFLSSASLLSLPFFLAGGLKLVYDALLYRSFSTMKPPEEN
ncbi:MAG TPA: MFS transporter [Anaerolineales bacterium]|nr:MFS transporter [Anaerolineales bacterium]